MNSPKYDDLTKQYSKYKNQFNNKLFDEQGNIITNQIWKPSWTPIEDVNIPQLQSLAAQMTASKAGGSSVTRSEKYTYLDREGNVTTDMSKAVGIKSATKAAGGSNSYNKKMAEDMEATLNELLKDANLELKLKQKFDVQKWAYEEYVRKSNDGTLSEEEREKYRIEAEIIKDNISDANGSVYGNEDFKQWMKNTIFPQFKNMEYNNITTSTTEGNTTYSEDFFKGNIAKNTPNYTEVEEVNVTGAPIERTNNLYVSPWSAPEFTGLIKQ